MAALWYTAVILLISYTHALKTSKNIKPQKYTVTDEAWFDVTIKDHYGINEDYTGRFVIALFDTICPMTVLNFKSIVRGYKRSGKSLHYKDTIIHRVVPDFVIQMGDTTTGDGTGGESIYGSTFVDENFELSHQAAGWVAMANHGKDTNGSQFFILLTRARWLDKKHVVFGKVIKGMDVVREIGELETNENTAVPKKTVKIVDCGLVAIDNRYDLTPEQANSNDDI